jgi:hypothetical protein
MTKKYYKYKETHRKVKGVQQKLCTKCIKWKGESEFHIERARIDGLSRLCRECNRAYERAWHRRGKKHIKKVLTYEESHRTVRGVKQKLCGDCKVWKKESLFHTNRRSKDELHWRCKVCECKYCRKRYEQIKKAGRKKIRNEDSHRVVNGVWKKLCSKCGRWKMESDFYNARSRKDGLTGYCKKCLYKPTGKSRKK